MFHALQSMLQLGLKAKELLLRRTLGLRCTIAQYVVEYSCNKEVVNYTDFIHILTTSLLMNSSDNPDNL